MLSIRRPLALLVFWIFAACAAQQTNAASDAPFYPANPALDRDGSRIALDVSVSDGGVQRRRIVVAPTRSGSPTHEITAVSPAQLHSPAFSADGSALFFTSVCLHNTCPQQLAGTRIIRYDFSANRWKVLTGPGDAEPFWTIGFQHLTPKLRPTQIARTDLFAAADGAGIHYLMSPMTPREVSAARDFAVRQLSNTGQDRFLATDATKTVGFRGPGSLAPYGRNRLIVLAASRNGGKRRKDPKGKAYGFILDATTGAVVTTLYRQDLKQAGIALPPAPHSLTGSADTAAAYFIAGDEVIALRNGALSRLGKPGESAAGTRPSLIALSRDGSRIAVFGVKGVPDTGDIVYHVTDTRTRATRAVRLAPEASASTRRIEIR